MKKKFKIFEIFNFNMSLESLLSFDIEYPINISYKLYKIKEILDDIENYVLKRISKLFPDIDFNNMNEQEKIVYDTIFNSDIDIDIPRIDIEDIISNDNAKISVKDIKNLDLLLSKSK